MRSFSGTNSTPRFDLERNPPYQINYRAKRCGKTITASKRRITFQFGFSSASAISSGMTAVDCRGEEHEVVLIWSHMSGKRELFMDGRQIHTSKGAMGNSEFMHSWALGNHILKITAHGSSPMGGEANFRQFDLELDGMSYFAFKQIYQLGGDASDVPRLALPPSTTTKPRSTESLMYKYVGTAVDEDEYDEDETPVSEVRAAPRVDLFDSQPPTTITYPTSQFGSMPNRCAPPAHISIPSMSQVSSSMPPLTVSNSNSMFSMSSYDEFAPVAVPETSRFDIISSQILDAYKNTNSNYYAYEPSHATVKEETRMDDMAKSMNNLVNLDDITSPKNKSTMMNQRFTAGRAPTLSEINSAVSPTPIMNSPPAPMMQQKYYNQGLPQHGYHPGQPQDMSLSYGFNFNQQQRQQYGYAPTY